MHVSKDMQREGIVVFFLLIAHHVHAADQATVDGVEDVDKHVSLADETVVNQNESICALTCKNLADITSCKLLHWTGDVEATVVDSPQFFSTSGCPKCAVDEHFERGTHGGYVSCECVRRASGRVQSDMIVDEQNRDLVNAIFGRENGIAGSVRLSKLYWPPSEDGTVEIPYIVGPSFPGNYEEIFFQAINALEKNTCIRFVDRTSEDDFIEVIGQDGCWSYLGKRGGKQQLSIGIGCNRTGIILHEFLHALGFLHEHSRPDRDRYITIQLENVIPVEKHNFDTVTLTGDVPLLPYDYDSVTHFGQRAYSKNGEKTIVVKDNDFRGVIGQRDRLSRLDILKINAAYCANAVDTGIMAPPKKRSSDVQEQCGIPKIKLNTNQRIVGGAIVESGAIPWQVSIRFHRRYTAICGGSLIGPKWVLTAAHCVKTKLTKYYSVYLGIHEKYPKEKKADHVILVEVAKVILHPQYNAKTMENDIALVQLKKPVQYNDYIQPICLMPATKKLQNDQKVTVSGWGDTSESRTRATHLMKVDLRLVKQKTCQEWLKPHVIYDNMICAGYEMGQKDACQGDSGGPLTQTVKGKTYLVGVVSWGLGCAKKKKPGVYAKVSYYRDWIEENSGI